MLLALFSSILDLILSIINAIILNGRETIDINKKISRIPPKNEPIIPGKSSDDELELDE